MGYPDSVYSPRTKENKSGISFSAGDTTRLFAEDVVNLDDEIVAIETDLIDKIDNGIQKSMPISVDSIRRGSTALTPLTTPTMVNFLGVIHYIQWPAVNEDILNSPCFMFPVDLKSGTAFKINVWVSKGGASNEYFQLNCGGIGSSGSSSTFIPTTETLISATGNVKLTFTASADLDKVEAGGYFYIYFQHGPSSANTNTISLLAIEFEYTADF